MKKKLFILILAFLGIFSFIGCAGSEYDTTSIITDDYNIDFAFNDNIKWDLDTGLYEDNTNFCSTSREQLLDTNITLNDYTKADYLLIWNDNNNYIGYYTLGGAYQGGDKFISDISSNVITLDDNAFKIALMNDKNGVNGYFKWGSSYLSYTYAEIYNNPVDMFYQIESIDDNITVEGYEDLTYRDIFGDSLYGIGTNNLYNNGEFNTIPSFNNANGLIASYNASEKRLDFDGTLSNYGSFNINGILNEQNHSYYLKFDIYTDAPTIKARTYLGGVYNGYVIYNLGLNKFSDIINTNVTIQTLVVYPSYANEQISGYIDNLLVLDLTTLFVGYTIPTQEQFETMLSEYKRITSISSDGIYLGDIDNTLEEYYNLDSDAEIDYSLSLMDNNVDYYNYDNLINDTNYYANITEDIADNYIYKSANDGLDSSIDYGIGLEQLVINGDFENGINEWDTDGSSLAIINSNELQVTDNRQSSYFSTDQDISLQNIYYYIYAEIYSINGLTDLSLQMRFGDGIVSVDNLSNLSANTDYILKGVATGTANSSGYIRLLTNDIGVGKEFVIKNIRLIPITDTPLENLTVSEIDEIGLPYFEGENVVYNTTIKTLGKNLFNSDNWVIGGYYNAGGLIAPDGISLYYNDFITIKSSTQYMITTSPSSTQILEYDSFKNLIGRTYNQSGLSTFTTSSNTRFLKISYYQGNHLLINTSQLEEGTTATTYEEYYPATNIFNMTDMYSEYESYLTADTVNNYLDTDLNSIQNYDLSIDTNSDGLADNFSDNLTDITDNTLSTFTYFNTMMNENITNGQYVKAINVAQDYNGDTTEDGILLEYIGLTSEINDYTTNIVSLEIDGITDCSIAVLVGYYDKDDTGIVKWGYSIITPIDTDGIYYFDFENDNGLTATYDYYTIRFNVIDSLGSLSFVGTTESFILKSLGLYDSYAIFKDIIDTNLQTYHYIEEMTFPDVTDTDYNDYFLYNDLGNETATTGNFNLLANYGVDDNVYFITFTEEAITDYIDIYYNDTFNSTTNFSYDDYFTYFNSMNMLDYQYLFNYSDTEMYQDLFTERDYILSLYWDYKNNVDRWEWYQDYGINNLNYTIFMNEYDERVLETNPLSLDSLDDITAITTYDIIVEEEEDIITNFEEFLQSITGESAFIYKVIIVIVILVTVIGLALLKADFMILTFITITELLFFVLIGWLSNWIALFIGIIAFILLLLKFKGVGGSGE